MKTKGIMTLEYQGKSYLIREGNHKAGGNVVFGSRSLNDALFDAETNDYKDRQAQGIDESIYAFVDDKVLETYSDGNFNKYINEYYD